MKLFADPSESLLAAQVALQQAEARIFELTAEREAKIGAAEGEDYIGAVAKIDAELDRLRSAVGAHRDRVVAMQARRDQQDRARLEQEKTAGIADVSKRLSKRHEAARKLDAALKQVADAFAELIRADEDAFSNFPSAVSPLGRLNHFHLDALEPLSARRRPRPPSAGLVRCVAEHDAFNLADAIEQQNRECIEMLDSQPVAAPIEDAAA
jgi:hypothetical protein